MTTWTVQPSGGDYTTLSAALSNASTVAGDIIEISGDWTSATDATACAVNDNNITIRTKVGDQARHAGFDNEGSNYELAVTSGHCITVNNTGLTVDGLLILINHTGSSAECFRLALSDNDTITIVNSILRAATSGTTDQDGVYVPGPGITANFENVMFIGFGRAGFRFSSGSGDTGDFNFISCTAWDCGSNAGEVSGGGIDISIDPGTTANINMHNCCYVGNSEESSDDFNDSNDGGTANWNLDNCICSDVSISGNDSGAVNATESATFTDGAPGVGTVVAFQDITTAPFDLRLQDDANNDAQDQHANAAGAGLTIGDYTTGDIAGTSRPQNTNYDIGAFEVVAVGGIGDDEEFAGTIVCNEWQLPHHEVVNY